MSKKEELDVKALLAELNAVKAEKEKLALELQQKAKGGRAIDEYALLQTELNLENNVTKLFSIYMMLSLYFKIDTLQSNIDSYIQKMEMYGKTPPIKTTASLVARIAKSLILSKKSELETQDILFKHSIQPLIDDNEDGCPL